MIARGDLTGVTGVLRDGGVVVFPTDTVWGVGALMSSEAGISRLYQIKRREPEKPSQVLVSNVDMANRYGVMSKKARELAGGYWPGGLTIVVKARGNNVSKMVKGRGGTVGLRSPDSELVQEMLAEPGGGIVASSANFAGRLAPKRFEEIEKDFLAQVDYVVGGESGGKSSSTVVEVRGDSVVVLREGAVGL